jgi:hypothetical protein
MGVGFGVAFVHPPPTIRAKVFVLKDLTLR